MKAQIEKLNDDLNVYLTVSKQALQHAEVADKTGIGFITFGIPNLAFGHLCVPWLRHAEKCIITLSASNMEFL